MIWNNEFSIKATCFQHSVFLFVVQIKAGRTTARRGNQTSTVSCCCCLCLSRQPIRNQNFLLLFWSCSRVQARRGHRLRGRRSALSRRLRSVLWTRPVWDETQPAHLQVGTSNRFRTTVWSGSAHVTIVTDPLFVWIWGQVWRCVRRCSLRPAAGL